MKDPILLYFIIGLSFAFGSLKRSYISDKFSNHAIGFLFDTLLFWVWGLVIAVEWLWKWRDRK